MSGTYIYHIVKEYFILNEISKKLYKYITYFKVIYKKIKKCLINQIKVSEINNRTIHCNKYKCNKIKKKPKQCTQI